MSKKLEQSLLFQGIYEFEDPSGTLLAAKVPYQGSVDLYDGTVVIVRPNQCCLFIYKGEVADLLLDGTHTLKTDNIPVLTSLANYRLGFKNPLRAELWFFSGQVFTSRRWGSPSPILVNIEGQGTIPLRMFGTYNLVLRDPVKFFRTLVGTRAAFDITELEEFVQGQIQELAPNALKEIRSLEKIGTSQEAISQKLEELLEEKLKAFGLKILELQVHSISPGQEVLKAMEAKAAMQTIGDPKAYLLYQAAQSLNQAGSSGSVDDRGNDPMQMMLGLMLGKNLVNDSQKEKSGGADAPVAAKKKCKKCASLLESHQKFCGDCGAKQ